MLRDYDSFRGVGLVRPDDPDYIAFLRRMMDARPGRGGPRAAGEFLGGLVERAIRHWLGSFVPLQEERILRWEQRLKNGRHGTCYREIDAVWRIDDESYCLFEMKLTIPENMERGLGARQLGMASETLFADKSVRYVLKRLVYVSEEPVAVLEDDVPVVAPDDENQEIGVVWVPPAAVEAAALDLGLDLPDNWLLPEAREGTVDDPEREEWRQFADTGPSETEGGGAGFGALADALRRALPDERR